MGKITAEVTMPDETEKIRQEIRHTEAEITDTLHSIEGKFTPTHLREEMRDKLRYYSITGVTKLTETVRRRPISAALVGAGALWFIIRRRRKRGKTAGAVKIGTA